MKSNNSYMRACAALLVVFCLLCAPLTALAKKGEKNYNRGVEFEKMQQWERAAQEFALAVAANPSESEYQLHYRRAVFNASQRFMEQGRALADQGDYAGAYNAFRQAYGYDPINELAAAEMQRMLRLQHDKEGRNGTERNGLQSPAPNGGTNGAVGGVSRATSPVPTDVVPTMPASYRATTAQSSAPTGRAEQLRVVKYNGDLETFIRQLANDLNLNVIFDRDFPKRTLSIDLRDVTTARALDHIFLAQGLFFQKLDRRTILVADSSKRPQYQQLVLRTFYLSNMAPNDARSIIQSALPPNSGRQPQVVPNTQTNSVTVRDTPENIAIISQLLSSLDKDRAEVVMDVNIYEVSRNNLLQIGNQLGDATSLTNGLGGLLTSTFPFGAGQNRVTGATGTGTGKGTGGTATIVPNIVGGALLLPSSTVSLFQSKDNTRLLAATQVHAFDGEQSTTRIGQKVPVQTASVSGFNGINNGTGTAANGSGATNGLFSGGYPVIQYQDTGLILKFTPQVFPDQDVQVKMEIESNDVIGGAANLTPTFSQRSISGTARIPNNRTLMIASVMQDKQSDGRRGVPLLGLVPILGRLFATPTKSSNNSDIVVTVTPRVLRAPTITPADLEMRDSGSLQAPISQTIASLLDDAEREDQIAAARQLPSSINVQLPPAPAMTTASAAAPTTTTEAEPPPAFVPAPAALNAGTSSTAANTPTDTTTTAALINASNTNTVGQPADSKASDIRPANSFAPIVPAALTNDMLKHALVPAPTANTDAMTATPVPAVANHVAAAAVPAVENRVAPGVPLAPETTGAALMLISNQPEMRVGERQRLLVLIKTGTPLNLAATTLRFDPRLFAVRSVTKGNMFDGAASGATLTQSIDPTGSLFTVIAPTGGTPINGMGVLFVVELEALAAGAGDVTFEQAGVHFMATDGRGLAPQLAQAHLVVKQ